MRWGDALLAADVSRFGAVEAVGVDETLFWRQGRWKKQQWCTSVVASQIVAWHLSAATNGPTEALNNLIKRIKRAAFGFRNTSPTTGSEPCSTSENPTGSSSPPSLPRDFR